MQFSFFFDDDLAERKNIINSAVCAILFLIRLADDYIQFISQNQRDEIQRKFDALRDSCSVSKADFLFVLF